MNRTDIQSVILNFNKNYANSKGYQFTQLINQQLEINPNSMVALYNGNLVRKPIVLAEDTVLSIDLISAFPSLEQQTEIGAIKADLVPLFTDKTKFPGFDVTIPKGHYSKLSFCRVLTEVMNQFIKTNYKYVEVDTITPISGGEYLSQSFPYQFFYEMKNDNFFLGLRYLIDNSDQNSVNVQSDINRVTFQELDTGFVNKNAITISGQTGDVINRTTSVANWDAYALGNSPIRGMGAFSNDDRNQLENDVGYSNCHIMADFQASGTQEFQFVFGMNNTFYSEKWGSAGLTVGTVNCDGSNVSIPQVLIGCRLDISLDSDNETINRQTFEVYSNNELDSINYSYFDNQTVRDDTADRNCKTLTQLNLTDYGVSVTDGFTLGYEFYSEPIPPSSYENLVLEEERVYYFKVLCSSGYGNYNSTVLYDSKKNGVQVNSQLVESGYLFQQLDAFNDITKATTGGLCPQYYFYNSDTNLKVTNMKQSNSVFFDTDQSTFVYQQGHTGYGFLINKQTDVNTTSLENILGIAQNTEETLGNIKSSENTLYNPNAYPERPEMGGLTQLESDKTRYNIELNLPIKCFNTTESIENNLGQTRTVIYNTNPVIEDLTNITSGLITGSIEPNNIKFMSLNNQSEIKLNNIDVSIRRAKTNELAEEITDASIELLIQSEPKNEQINVLV